MYSIKGRFKLKILLVGLVYLGLAIYELYGQVKGDIQGILLEIKNGFLLVGSATIIVLLISGLIRVWKRRM